MQRIISQIYQGLAWVFLAGLLIEFYLVGAAIFGAGVSFMPHRMLGSALVILAILFPVLALVGRLGRSLIGFSLLLALLTIIQVMLPSLRVNVPWLAALHPVNALALMGVSAMLRRQGRTIALPVS